MDKNNIEVPIDIVKLYVEENIEIASTKRINGILVSSDKILTQIIINCKEILKELNRLNYE